jgi:hypothetical protein
MIGFVIWLGAAVGGLWALERMRKRRDELGRRRLGRRR